MAAIRRLAGARLLCGTALTLCLGSQALAQSTNTTSLDPIIVRERDDRGNKADKATSVYVADAELERARMGDLKDLFAGLASVSVGGAIPIAQKIFVNGVDMLNLAVTVDGVAQNNRIFHHASANAFDPALMKSVRVDPGVAPADAGPFALAGGVVMETVDAEDFLDEGDDFGGNLRLSYADNGETFQSALTFGGRMDGFEYLVYGKAADGNDYVDGAGITQTGTRADLTASLVKLAYETEAGGRFEFSTQKMLDTELRNRRANFGPGAGDVYELYDTRRTVNALSFEANNDGAMWDPTIVLGFSETVVNKPDPFGSMGTTNTYSAKVQNTFHLANGDTIVAGIDYQDKKGFYVDPSDGPFEEVSKNVGVFVQARLAPTEQLSISGGLRYDWQDFSGMTNYLALTNFQDSYAGLSGNLSVAYDVTDTVTVRGGYSNVFGGIQIEDNYIYWDDFDYAALEPTRSQNVVLGVDYAQGPLSLGAEVFRTKINNVRNGGSNYDFQSEGYNLYGTYGWDRGFARLTFSHSEQTRDGTPQSSFSILDTGAPLGDVLALEVQQKIPNLDLLVGGSVQAAFPYDSGAMEFGGIQEIAGYEVVNLFAEYSPRNQPNMTIRAEVQNLFDEQYADRATYGVDYTNFTTLKEPGRTFVITAVAKF